MSLELVCPAGTPAALRAAVDAGADTCLLRLPRLHQRAELPRPEFRPGRDGRGRRLRAQAQWPQGAGRGQHLPARRRCQPWHDAIDNAARGRCRRGDPGRYRRAGLRRDAASEFATASLGAGLRRQSRVSIAFYRDRFDIRRVVLPRVLSIEEVARADRPDPASRRKCSRSAASGTMVGRALLSCRPTSPAVAEHGRRLRARRHVSYREEDGLSGVAARRRGDEPLRHGRAGGLSRRRARAALCPHGRTAVSVRGAGCAERRSTSWPN